MRTLGRGGEIIIRKLFVNARAGDAEDMAVLIDERLRRVFGPERVFRSSRSPRPGAAFPAELVAEATSCAAMLVVIGRDWLSPGAGGRRIDAPADRVRTEIELALASGRPVVPVLVGDRPRLTAKDTLPATISTLVEHNHVRVHHRSAETDLLTLVDKLRPHVEDAQAPPRPTDSARLATLAPTQRSSDVRLGPATINNRYYGDSIVFRPQLFAHDVRGAITFDLGRQYRRLETTAGVLDDATEPDQVGVFQVLADGVMRMETMARHGGPRILNINVTDVHSLRLIAYRPGTTAHPALAGVRTAGGRSTKLPELAWGNPVVHP